jgi:hypothetical protein
MRSMIGISLALLMVLGSVAPVSADTTPVERFSFARPPAPDSTIDPKSRLDVVIDRWSSDAERDRMISVIAEKGHAKLLDAFWDVSRIGTLHWPGGLEYAVRYARRVARPDGTADVVLVVERPLWVWWDTNMAKMAASPEHPFTVIQLRVGKDGKGEGRVSFGVPFESDKTAGVVLRDFTKAPALLTDVHRENS